MGPVMIETRGDRSRSRMRRPRINEASGLQADLNGNSTANGDKILQNARRFASLSQRWAMTQAPDGNWKISNIANGLCLDSASAQGVAWTVQNPCGIVVYRDVTFPLTAAPYTNWHSVQRLLSVVQIWHIAVVWRVS
jgi:Ricin-type beta-trefoil lectin domain-like